MNFIETIEPGDTGPITEGGVGTFGRGLISGGEFSISTIFLQPK